MSATTAAMVFEPYTAIIIVLVGVVTYMLYRMRASSVVLVSSLLGS
jgi:hypothetical protein